jgi:hypothetical protein
MAVERNRYSEVDYRIGLLSENVSLDVSRRSRKITWNPSTTCLKYRLFMGRDHTTIIYRKTNEAWYVLQVR